MHKITIIAVGKVRDPHLQAGIADYLGRIRHDLRCEEVVVRDSDPEREGKKIAALLQKRAGPVFALGQEGRQYASAAFAAMLHSIEGEAAFVIGGPEGLSPEVKLRCREVISLSAMTLPHELARLVLAEQMYRAVTIWHNRKYHR